MRFMLFDLPTIPAASWEEREQLKPIGRNRERYQQMLEEMRAIVQLADEVGFEVFGTTEHHFHSEGIEASVAPMLLYTDLAARTKNIKFAPLGLVLAGWDPIRCAEELAVFDNLTKGRLIAGFARGYQDRWVNVLGQQYPRDRRADGWRRHRQPQSRGSSKMRSPSIKKAWTEESFNYNGKFYQIPYPYEEGITRWPAADFTRKYGAPGEIDENGVIRNVCVIPKPYQDPHPPLMQTIRCERAHTDQLREEPRYAVDPERPSGQIPEPVQGLPGHGQRERPRPVVRAGHRRRPPRYTSAIPSKRRWTC